MYQWQKIIVSQPRNYVIQSNFSSQSSQPATIQHIHPVLGYALTILSPHHACKFKMTPQQLSRFVFNDFRRTSSVTTSFICWMIYTGQLLKPKDNMLHLQLIRTVFLYLRSPISGYLAGIQNQYLFELFFPFNHEALECPTFYAIDFTYLNHFKSR